MHLLEALHRRSLSCILHYRPLLELVSSGKLCAELRESASLCEVGPVIEFKGSVRRAYQIGSGKDGWDTLPYFDRSRDRDANDEVSEAGIR